MDTCVKYVQRYYTKHFMHLQSVIMEEMTMNKYAFCQNKECEYFPCHKGIKEEDFNCLFCYCPLYALADQCGGCFTYTAQGIKDCSNCVKPHMRSNYQKILEKMPEIMEIAKRQEETT